MACCANCLVWHPHEAKQQALQDAQWTPGMELPVCWTQQQMPARIILLTHMSRDTCIDLVLKTMLLFAHHVLQTGALLKEGDWVSVNGTTGEVIKGQQPVKKPALTGQ